MHRKPTERVATDGLAASGLWVRRQAAVPSLLDEALALNQMLQTWNLQQSMTLEHCRSVYAEVSSPDLRPTWVYLVEVIGDRDRSGPLPLFHPLSQVMPGERLRIIGLVEPREQLILGALVETATQRRMLWLQFA